MIVGECVSDVDLEVDKTGGPVHFFIQVIHLLGGFHQVGRVDMKIKVVNRHVLKPSSQNRYGEPCRSVPDIQIQSAPKHWVRRRNMAPASVDIGKNVECFKPVFQRWDRHARGHKWDQ